MNVPVIVHPLSAPVAALLPSADPGMRDLVAQALASQVRRLALESWANLLRHCAESLPEDPAAALGAAAREGPEPDLLMTRLDGVITPGLLLSLPIADRTALEAALLAHGDAQVREQTLDALHQPGTGCEPLRGACTAWSMRMLVAELGRVPGLSHSNRLRLQDQLLALARGGDGPSDRTETRTLREALRGGTDRLALEILAERAGLKPESAETAAALRDPRMLAALCWRAGCDPEETVAVQVQLGRIPPDQVMHPDPDGRWPLDTARMQWHIAMLEEL
jgi:hypothetical protein